MEEIKRLPDSELEIMKVVWQYGAITRSDIQQHIAHKAWKTATFQALLARLEEKGFLGHEKQGNTFVYTACISREEFYAMQSERFVEENFSGNLPSFLAAFTRRRSLSRAEIEEIRRMIDEFEEV